MSTPRPAAEARRHDAKGLSASAPQPRDMGDGLVRERQIHKTQIRGRHKVSSARSPAAGRAGRGTRRAHARAAVRTLPH